jgi:myo-inositol-1(or 4)-monophosphatase
VPYVAVSIGFTLNRCPTIGVVLNPFTAQLYTAIRSQGAFLTLLSPDLSTTQSTSKLPLYCPQPLDFQSSVIAIEFGSDRHGHNYTVKVDTFRELASTQGGMVHALRAYGSAALNLCSVASGFIDGYWEGGTWEWDVCAGWIILEEAGGLIVSGNAPHDPSKEELRNPDLCGRVYLGVRKGTSQKEMEDWVRKFWALIKGKLSYGR